MSAVIDIRYDRGKRRVHIEGHARYAGNGRDIVCSAVSVLAYTLARAAEKYGAPETSLRLHGGFADIECPSGGDGAAAAAAFDAVCGGFELMAENYPEYVRYAESF